MYTITRRDIAGLTPTEQRRFRDWNNEHLGKRLAHRSSCRAVRAAIDHDENNGEQQIPPDAE